MKGTDISVPAIEETEIIAEALILAKTRIIAKAHVNRLFNVRRSNIGSSTEYTLPRLILSSDSKALAIHKCLVNQMATNIARNVFFEGYGSKCRQSYR